ncbi:MAG: proteasome activator [Acidimicrobiales bacterium]
MRRDRSSRRPPICATLADMSRTERDPAEPPAPEDPDDEPQGSSISDPAKLIRLGTMLQTLMAEVRAAGTDEESRRLLARIHKETVEELGTVLSGDLMDELAEFARCCDAEGVPTESEIRVAQAQLVGWLQGLLQGLQASMAAQQAAAAHQLQELARGGRAPSLPGPPGRPGGPGLPEQTGTYL